MPFEMNRMLKIVSVIGTRPDVIKMAPIAMEMRRCADHIDHMVVATAQHRDMLDQILKVFDMAPDIDLDLMEANQTPAAFFARALTALDKFFDEISPDVILVQGDTTTTFTAALAAFYHRIPVGHVEAGLRTHDLDNPFPEEMNRRLAAPLVTFHFAPTARARQNLISEGIAPDQIFVTGNTVVDALMWIVDKMGDTIPPGLEDVALLPQRLVLVTAHRREHFGPPMEEICRALVDLTHRFPDIAIVFPVHPNPNVDGPVRSFLAGRDRILLMPPVDYTALVWLMRRAVLILTDSGGIQEEAPAFGTPILVLRKRTERPEAIEAGCSLLVELKAERIVHEARAILTGQRSLIPHPKTPNPFGDGKAAKRIVDILVSRLGHSKS
jgi:UDP-N-acetylglucosamine 2-epimerase (non-hydrolysing)